VSGERSLYLDSSALVKLVLTERESGALRHFLASASWRVSCTLARVEVLRAVKEKGPRVVATARRVLEGVDLIELDNELLELAADLPEPLRSLNAIHVAAAMELGDELEALVTYDAQMARKAKSLGLPVLAPA
jgi:predicted nucleic acid-binding protein